jgi:hypothetical protein
VKQVYNNISITQIEKNEKHPLHTNDFNVKNIKNIQNIRTVLASDSIKASLPERVKQTKGKVINKL